MSVMCYVRPASQEAPAICLQIPCSIFGPTPMSLSTARKLRQELDLCIAQVEASLAVLAKARELVKAEGLGCASNQDGEEHPNGPA